MNVQELSQLVMKSVWAADEAANVCENEYALGGYYAAHSLAYSLIGGKTPIKLGDAAHHRREAVNIAKKLGAHDRTFVVRSWTL